MAQPRHLGFSSPTPPKAILCLLPKPVRLVLPLAPPALLVLPLIAAAAAAAASLCGICPLTARLGWGSILVLLPAIEVLGLAAFLFAVGLASISASAPASENSSSRCESAVLVCRLWFVTVTVEEVDAVDGA